MKIEYLLQQASGKVDAKYVGNNAISQDKAETYIHKEMKYIKNKREKYKSK